MTIYTPLATLETRYSLTATQLYKLLEVLNLKPKQSLSTCYLDQLQEKSLEDWLDKSVYSHSTLGEFLKALETPNPTYLYQCSNCEDLWLSSSLLKEDKSLLHACPRTFKLKEKHSGYYLLLAAGKHEEMCYLAQAIARHELDDSRKFKRAS